MKKFIKYIMLLTIFSIGLIGCGKKGYVEITYSELQVKVNNKENLVLFVGRESCSACSTFKEILNERIPKEHKNLTIYYIDLAKLTDEELIKFNSTYDYSATPTTFIITSGKPSNLEKYEGYDSYDKLIKKLIEKGFIKGDK